MFPATSCRPSFPNAKPVAGRNNNNGTMKMVRDEGKIYTRVSNDEQLKNSHASQQSVAFRKLANKWKINNKNNTRKKIEIKWKSKIC